MRSVCVLAFIAGLAAQNQKQYKSQAEYELYGAVAKDFAANSFAKALADLDAWKNKYPDSEFKDDRQLLFVQAYSGVNQPAKAIDAASELLSKDVQAIFNPADVVRLLYAVVVAIPRVAEPTSAQLQAASQAARQLRAFDKIPPGVALDAWTRLRADFETASKSALLYVALVPIAQSIKAENCSAAEASAIELLGTFPDSAQAAWYLAQTELCLYKAHPERASFALYELARAASLDPAKGMADAKWQQSVVQPNLEKLYRQYHGEDRQGLQGLKDAAVKSPLPPKDFLIKSKIQIEQDKEADFTSKNPELALWLKIKAELSAHGEQYFADELKDAAVSQLYGTLVEAKPECRPKQLLVAIRTADSAPGAPAEILLRLDKPLAGKPEAGSQFRWEGVARAFTKDPFLLTMDVETVKITGLTARACMPRRR